MIRWSETFWGDGNRGFDVLTSNVKNGGNAIEEFQRILTESYQCETTYYTKLSRLQSQCVKVQNVGSFVPIWHSIRDLIEKLSQAHGTTANIYQELLRDVHNYQESYQKKRSSMNKDSDFARTAEIIPLLNSTLNTVNKSKEQYQTVGLDYERAKRSGNNLNNGSSTPVPSENSIAQSALNTLTSSTRQFERLEKKFRQSHDDYRSSVEKYNSLRNEFEKRFYDACQKFQDFENEHAEKMLNFAVQYSDILKRNNDQIRTAQNEFSDKLKQMTVNDLVDSFVEQKRTGSERPQALQFEELDNVRSSLVLTGGQNYPSSVTPDITQSVSEELIDLDGIGFPVPSFQPHFPVSSPTMSSAWPSSSNIGNRNELLTSTTSLSSQQVFNPTQSMSPVLNNNNGSMSLSNPNNPLSRLQGANDQSSNPFEVIIRRPAFKNFWPTNRREPKKKKDEKKASKGSKQNSSQQKQQTISEDAQGYSLNDETHDFNRNIGSIDGLHQLPNLNKNKCPTPEPYTHSSPSMPQKDAKRQLCQSTIPFSSSATRKSTSSSDSSDDDDDDDRPPSKINFTIKPTEPKASNIEGNDDAKIISAMRFVERSIGPLSTLSRSTIKDERGGEMSKSISTSQILNPRIPPPLPSRPNPSMPISFTTENFPPPSAFPSSSSDVGLTNIDDAFNPKKKIVEINVSRSENAAPFTLHPRPNFNAEKTKFLSTIDDDVEVAKTFNGQNELPNGRAARTRYSMQPTLSNIGPTIGHGRTTPFISSMSQSFTNGLMNSFDQRSSPITIGPTDQIPIAVAFQETIHVMMSGDDRTKWKIRVLGDMLISFPAAILSLIVDPSPSLNVLEFRLKNLNRVENIIANPQLISTNSSTNETESTSYAFDMSALSNVLKSLQEKNRSLPFFNFGILKYEVKHSGVTSIPVVVSSNWTRNLDRITVQVNYRFNSSTFPGSIRMVDDVVVFSSSIADGQEIEQSTPSAEWSNNEHKISWKVPYTFDGSGKLSATIKCLQTNAADGSDNEQKQTKPLTTSSIIHVRFLAENSLLSSIDFDFACRGYKISLLKKKIQSGKYQSEPDSNGPLHLFKRPSLE